MSMHGEWAAEGMDLLDLAHRVCGISTSCTMLQQFIHKLAKCLTIGFVTLVFIPFNRLLTSVPMLRSR